MYLAWICAACDRPQKFKDNIFSCVGCGKEICDSCGWLFWTCKACCVGKTERQVAEGAIAAGIELDLSVYSEAYLNRQAVS